MSMTAWCFSLSRQQFMTISRTARHVWHVGQLHNAVDGGHRPNQLIPTAVHAFWVAGTQIQILSHYACANAIPVLYRHTVVTSGCCCSDVVGRCIDSRVGVWHVPHCCVAIDSPIHGCRFGSSLTPSASRPGGEPSSRLSTEFRRKSQPGEPGYPLAESPAPAFLTDFRERSCHRSVAVGELDALIQRRRVQDDMFEDDVDLMSQVQMLSSLYAGGRGFFHAPPASPPAKSGGVAIQTETFHREHCVHPFIREAGQAVHTCQNKPWGACRHSGENLARGTR